MPLLPFINLMSLAVALHRVAFLLTANTVHSGIQPSVKPLHTVKLSVYLFLSNIVPVLGHTVFICSLKRSSTITMLYAQCRGLWKPVCYLRTCLWCWTVTTFTFDCAQCCMCPVARLSDPYHICVGFYGVLHDAGVFSGGASFPAAIQLNQGTAAIVACESAVCKCRPSLTLDRYWQNYK